MLWKNLPEEELKSVMRTRWVLDYLAAFEMLLLKFNWGDFLAVIKARRAFKKWRKSFERTKRQCYADKRTPYSILWQYYAKKNDTFDKLQEI